MVRLLVSKVSAKSSARCQPLPCNSRIIANRRSVLFIQILFLFSCPRTRYVKTPLAAIIAQTIPRGNLHCLPYPAILVPLDPRGQDNPSQYFVEDRSHDADMVRLMIQDRLMTAGMGGPLSEQADPASLHHVLDIGCGPGGWILEAARLYPHMELTGIDISWRMIEYARAEAQARKITDGVEFRVMDALRPLEFPEASFDLVNLCLGSSFLLVKDWPTLPKQCLRVT